MSVGIFPSKQVQSIGVAKELSIDPSKPTQVVAAEFVRSDANFMNCQQLFHWLNLIGH